MRRKKYQAEVKTLKKLLEELAVKNFRLALQAP